MQKINHYSFLHKISRKCAKFKMNFLKPKTQMNEKIQYIHKAITQQHANVQLTDVGR